MVPTSSTSITLLLGDCLATTVMYQKKFSKEKFKTFHPGGNIGSSLLLAKDIMVTGSKMPVTNYKNTFVITRGIDRCIWIYPLGEWEKIERELSQLSSLSKTNRIFLRNHLRHAKIVSSDEQGRLILTKKLLIIDMQFMQYYFNYF